MCECTFSCYLSCTTHCICNVSFIPMSRLTLATTTADSNATTDAATRPVPTRKLSVDPHTVEVIEKRLTQRPDKQELVERNILKGAHSPHRH